MAAYLKGSVKPALLARSTYLLPWLWLSLPGFELSADQVAARLRSDQLWGTLRVFRFLERQRARDQAGLSELYWRTPLEGFRRLVADLAGAPPAPQFAGGTPEGPWIDALTGLHSAGTGYLKPGSVPQRLFAFLAADGFRAFGLPEIFEGVFVDEPYDPEKSREKTLKALRALERWFKQNRAPVQLHEEQIGGAEVFEIRARAPGLRWRLAHAASDDPRGEDFRRSLEDWFGRRTFAASEAAKRLGASVRTVNRRLQALEAEGWVESLGQGRARKHRLR
jgi:hypothetical protein